jgi:hypothetical protein
MPTSFVLDAQLDGIYESDTHGPHEMRCDAITRTTLHEALLRNPMSYISLGEIEPTL